MTLVSDVLLCSLKYLQFFFLELDGKKIRVDFSITKRAHTPTPGQPCENCFNFELAS